jgi:hypothetical protein
VGTEAQATEWKNRLKKLRDIGTSLCHDVGMAIGSAAASALNIDMGSPIFLIERTSYSLGQRPVDYGKLHYRGGRIRFVTRLARRPPGERKGVPRK